MSDTIEQRIRAILADEVQGLQFGVSADRVRLRLAQRRRRRAIRRIGFVAAAAAAVVVAVGTFAIYNHDQKPIVAATASPSASQSPVIATPAPSGSPRVAPTTLPTSTGTMTLDIGLPIAGTADFPVVCSWVDSRDAVSFQVVATPATLFGEQVTASLVDDGTSSSSPLILQRPNGTAYSGGVDLPATLPQGSLQSGVTLSLEASPNAAVPFQGASATDELTGTVSVYCGWPPLGVPAPALLDSSVQSRGSATLALDAPASTSVTTPIDCQWGSRTRVLYYSFPEYVGLFGEEVSLDLGDGGQPTNPKFTIYRWNLADYDGTGATYQADGYGAGNGAIHFESLTPNPQSYPINQPLPSPLDPFIKPIGGNTAARSLSGTMTWSCGTAPAGVPVVEPTPEPQPSGSPLPSGTPLAWPVAVLAVEGQPGSLAGSVQCVEDWYGPDGSPIGGQGECGGPSWFVPAGSIDFKAGSTLLFTVGGARGAGRVLQGRHARCDRHDPPHDVDAAEPQLPGPGRRRLGPGRARCGNGRGRLQGLGQLRLPRSRDAVAAAAPVPFRALSAGRVTRFGAGASRTRSKEGPRRGAADEMTGDRGAGARQRCRAPESFSGPARAGRFSDLDWYKRGPVAVTFAVAWGYSSAGRAPAWHAGGPGFESL